MRRTHLTILAARILSTVRLRSLRACEISRSLEARFDDVQPKGSLYVTLNRMRDDGLLWQHTAKGCVVTYSPSSRGRNQLAAFVYSAKGIIREVDGA